VRYRVVRASHSPVPKFSKLHPILEQDQGGKEVLDRAAKRFPHSFCIGEGDCWIAGKMFFVSRSEESSDEAVKSNDRSTCTSSGHDYC